MCGDIPDLYHNGNITVTIMSIYDYFVHFPQAHQLLSNCLSGFKLSQELTNLLEKKGAVVSLSCAYTFAYL